jgi:hypothetical protein
MTPAAVRYRLLVRFVAAAFILLPRTATPQDLAGTLIGTVRDTQGGVLRGAIVRVSSPALIGGPMTQPTNEKGHLRFPALPPGLYTVEVEYPGLASYKEEAIRIGAGATIDILPVLKLAEVGQTIIVEARASRLDAREPAFATRFGPDDLRAIPTRRAGMFDAIRAAPGVSPTSPSSATVFTVSAFGSGTNENQFLIDGTNTTCPCNGVARAELGGDFIQEVQIQSTGASVEFGSLQGAVFNVITRQGSDRFLHDASFYWQGDGLTSQPVTLAAVDSGGVANGYHREKYHDFTTTLGGPAVRSRLWFFAGYQYLRDSDSQPGADLSSPRVYEQDKLFAKLTWKPTPDLQVMHSLHEEFWVNPDPPTLVTPFEATRRRSASVPAMTLGHLTHTLSANTFWDVRVGRFFYDEERTPSTGDLTKPNRVDRVTGISSGAPPLIGGLTLIRTTAKATLNHYRSGLFKADHQWKLGAQFERGEQRGANVIPTGERFIDDNGRPFQRVSGAPSNTGGLSLTFSAFATDAITIRDTFTIHGGVRFDHASAISQALPVLDVGGRETGEMLEGLGTLFTWNTWSPRLGVTARLSDDGRTMLRGTYGRFIQGVLTGEFSSFHAGVTPTTIMAYQEATGGYTRLVRVNDPRINQVLDSRIRAPHTDEYALGVDREAGRHLAVAVAYVHKRGSDFIGWTDIGGHYREEMRTLEVGRTVPLFVLTNSTTDQRFLLTNPPGYSLRYDGLVMAIDKRRSHGWQAFGSYTFSRTAGLYASSGETAAGAQSSTIAIPTRTFGRDPNDLTNARGRLPNDRPHMLKTMGAIEIPGLGFVVAASLQHVSGKPWGATAQIVLPQGDQRVALEPRGTRRLPSQTLLDVRVSRTIRFGAGRLELLVDVLNALNETSGEGLASDNGASPLFGQPNLFVDPRRAMLGARLYLGR